METVYQRGTAGGKSPEHRLTHALSGEELAIRAPFPEDLRSFWLGLGGDLPADLD